MTKPRNCILCHQPTTGSVGVTGAKWPLVCQPCKDREDAEALRRSTEAAMIMDRILGE